MKSFIIVLFGEYYWSNESEGGSEGRACGIHRGNEKYDMLIGKHLSIWWIFREVQGNNYTGFIALPGNVINIPTVDLFLQ
jgi:hypothetical protein